MIHFMTQPTTALTNAAQPAAKRSLLSVMVHQARETAREICHKDIYLSDCTDCRLRTDLYSKDIVIESWPVRCEKEEITILIFALNPTATRDAIISGSGRFTFRALTS